MATPTSPVCVSPWQSCLFWGLIHLQQTFSVVPWCFFTLMTYELLMEAALQVGVSWVALNNCYVLGCTEWSGSVGHVTGMGWCVGFLVKKTTSYSLEVFLCTDSSPGSGCKDCWIQGSLHHFHAAETDVADFEYYFFWALVFMFFELCVKESYSS